MRHVARMLIGALILCGALAASGCVVVPRRAAPPPGCYWVPGHYDAHGYWVRGHCRR